MPESSGAILYLVLEKPLFLVRATLSLMSTAGIYVSERNAPACAFVTSWSLRSSAPVISCCMSV